jgi:hypothetical protein
VYTVGADNFKESYCKQTQRPTDVQHKILIKQMFDSLTKDNRQDLDMVGWLTDG